MDKTFIIDYDDTQAPNQHDYSYPHIEFIKFVLEKFGPHSPDVPTMMALYEDIGKSLVKTLGFTMQRFPTSLVKTLETISENLEIPITDKDKSLVYNIGMTAFDEKRYASQGLFPGVEKTLDFLLEQKDELILLTKGDPVVQIRKLRANKLEKWFGEQIYDLNKGFIVPTKNAQTILNLVKGKDLSKVYHVGNSIRSDVIPALEAGVKAIYCKLETWAYEREHNGLPEHKDLIIIKEFSDIMKEYIML